MRTMKIILYFIFSMVFFQAMAQNQDGYIPLLPAMDSLYPPTSFQADHAECDVWVHWSKPTLPGGGTPTGLLGYKIYRNGFFIYYLDNPDFLFLFDFNLDPGQYVYKATAYYDLTPYGQPGQFAESCYSNTDTIQQPCCIIMPFWEPWDGMFAYNAWLFSPSQGNWNISTSAGNPTPTAVFYGNPLLNNFDFHLISPPLGLSQVCAETSIEFDLKMEAINPGPSAQLFLDVYHDSTWYPKGIINNQNTDGWVHCKYDISEVSGIFLRFRFRAAGDSSSVIDSWMIDNIYVHFRCLPPDTIGYTISGNVVNLFWDHPCPDNDTVITYSHILGYNVFRTDSSGLPPYQKLNQAFVTDTFYMDTIPQSMLSGQFRYCSNIIYLGCDSDTSSSLLVTSIVGMNEMENITVRMFPNPTVNMLHIQSDIPIQGISLWSGSGDLLLRRTNLNDRNFSISTDIFPNGLYWMGISSHYGLITRKVIILHK